MQQDTGESILIDSCMSSLEFSKMGEKMKNDLMDSKSDHSESLFSKHNAHIAVPSFAEANE